MLIFVPDSTSYFRFNDLIDLRKSTPYPMTKTQYNITESILRYV